MVTSNDKSRARALQRSQPELKYTQALRIVQQPNEPAPNERSLTVGIDPQTGQAVTVSAPQHLLVTGAHHGEHIPILRTAANSALDGDWSIEIVEYKGDEFDRLRRRPEVAGHTPAAGHANIADIADYLASISAGTPSKPLLVLLSEADYFLTPPDDSDGDAARQAALELERLASAPHTAVVASISRITSATPPTLLDRLGNRLLIGRQSRAYARTVFGHVAGPDTTIPDTGEQTALLWHGERFSRINADRR